VDKKDSTFSVTDQENILWVIGYGRGVFLSGKRFESVAGERLNMGRESKSLGMQVKWDLYAVAGAIIFTYLIGSREAVGCDSTQTRIMS
jgi:hypothetical protein